MVRKIYFNLPDDVLGFTIYDAENEYAVVINSNLKSDEQENVYKIEESKINNGSYVKEVIRSAYI